MKKRSHLLRKDLAGAGEYDLTFGINNIFDTAAPFAGGGVLSNFDAGSGVNNIQRYFWVSVGKKF